MHASKHLDVRVEAAKARTVATEQGDAGEVSRGLELHARTGFESDLLATAAQSKPGDVDAERDTLALYSYE